MKKVMLVFGTRPEGIVTGQHREMLDQVLRIFEVVPDSELIIMKLPGHLRCYGPCADGYA